MLAVGNTARSERGVQGTRRTGETSVVRVVSRNEGRQEERRGQTDISPYNIPPPNIDRARKRQWQSAESRNLNKVGV